MLARHEQALQLRVLDHLREIDARRLYLRLGFSSLFDYTVRELHYTEAAAWRRIKAMRLCRETRGVRERLQDGSLNLSNAALLQNSFERWERSGGGPLAAGSAGAGPGAAGSGAAGTSAAPGASSAPAAAPGKAADAPAPAPAPVLDAHARQQLVERAMGKSTRQVQQMLAEVDPEAAAPAERLRPLGDGRWELKAVIDAECQRGLQQLRELLSHVDPHLTVGQLVGRLVREGVERYDPSRPPRRKRRKSDPAADECPRRQRDGSRQIALRLPRRTRAGPGRPRRRRSRHPRRSGPRRRRQSSLRRPCRQQAEALGKLRPRETSGRRRAAVLRRRSALRRVQSAPGAPPMRWRQSRLRRRRPAWQPAVRLRFRTRPLRRRSLRGSRQFDPGAERPAAGSAEPTSAAKLGVAGGAGSAGRTSAAKSGKSSGRSIPAAVRREVWRRDSGCCSYIDRHTGRRCGSRFFLEIDHIVPVARGGGAEPGNLRLRCSAHHRYRHARRQRSAPRDSVT